MRIFLFIFLIALSSCGKLKKSVTVNRDHVEVSTEERTTEEIVTTEKVDTLITLAPDTSSWTLPVPPADSSSIVMEDESVVVRLDFNKGTVKTTAIVKPKTVPVQIEKKTEIKRDIRVNTELEHKTYDREKEVEKTAPFVPWFVWIIVVIVAAAFFYIRHLLRTV